MREYQDIQADKKADFLELKTLAASIQTAAAAQFVSNLANNFDSKYKLNASKFNALTTAILALENTAGKWVLSKNTPIGSGNSVWYEEV